MRRTTLFASLIAAMPLMAGCGTNDGQVVVSVTSDMPAAVALALRDGTNFTLYSLDPLPALKGEEYEGEKFRGWPSLGFTRINNAKERSELLDALHSGVAAQGLGPARCFEPRHGISVVHDGKKYDIVICFFCSQAEWSIDGNYQGVFLTSKSPQEIFDRVLRDASIPLQGDAP